MKKLTIKYNPYTITTEFTIDGKQPKMDSSLNVGNSRLQEWADQLPNWLVKEYNDKNWDIQFTGTTDDFTDLLEGFSQNNAGVKAKFSTKRMPDVDETENYIKKIFDEIQRGPIKELKSKDIIEAFEKAKNQEFEINVVATMSSGCGGHHEQREIDTHQCTIRSQHHAFWYGSNNSYHRSYHR